MTVAHIPSIVVVVGPTASGKTALAVELAERFGGEVVNADSRQVYRFMDIGTAKPTAAERVRAPHHLIDIRNPDEPFGLADFLDAARQAIGDITSHGRLPIVAGGTGQYVRALLDGWQAPRVPPDPALRAALTALAEVEGADALHAELSAVDPVAAAGIDPRNVRRVVRALEVVRRSGRPFSEQRRKGKPPFRALVLGLALSRETLYARIDRRVDAMFAAGLVEEVQGLLARGYGCALPALNSIGYVEVCGFLAGHLTLSEAVVRTKTGTHRLARTQGAWFRRSDPAIHWLDAEARLPIEQAAAIVDVFLSGGP
jgi:tRNA dimethylallyltransferase